MTLFVAKVVDDINVADFGNNAPILNEQFDKHFELGTVASGREKLRFFWNHHCSTRRYASLNRC